MVLSNGERVAAPRFYRKRERKLKRANRALHRKHKGSANRAKARKRVARVHQKTANKRQDFLHKLSTRIIREHEAVCVENLAVNGLARTKLAKSIHDAGWSDFLGMLEYKALWHRKHLVKIGRWYPSTKLCGQCGALNDDLTLTDREWLCECGVLHDRDKNAACNIRQEGLRILGVSILAAGCAESQNACPQGGPLGLGPSVRPGLKTRHDGLKQEAAGL